MKPSSTEAAPEPQDAASRASQPERAERRQIFLRTLYPLNPGIPHYVDFPKGWQ